MMSTSGLLKQLGNKYFTDAREMKYQCSKTNSYTAHSISLEESTILFIILAIGIGVALLELLLEVFLSWIKKRMTLYGASDLLNQ